MVTHVSRSTEHLAQGLSNQEIACYLLSSACGPYDVCAVCSFLRMGCALQLCKLSYLAQFHSHVAGNTPHMQIAALSGVSSPMALSTIRAGWGVCDIGACGCSSGTVSRSLFQVATITELTVAQVIKRIGAAADVSSHLGASHHLQHRNTASRLPEQHAGNLRVGRRRRESVAQETHNAGTLRSVGHGCCCSC